MTSRTAAARYARALLDVAVKESADLDAIAKDLDEFGQFLQQQTTLYQLLVNPAVPAPRKRGAMQEITARAQLRPVVAKLLVLLADRDRLALFREIAAVYHDLLAERNNVVRALVTSAETLSPERLNAIEQQLTATTGKHVAMTTRVDPSIIGGVIARVGSTVYDASLATQLRKIRERLSA